MNNDLEPNLEFDKVTKVVTNKLIYNMEKVKINKEAVEKLIDQGVSKKDIKVQLYPALNDMQWTKALKMMGLSAKRVPKVDFIIEDLETVTSGGPHFNPKNQADNSTDKGLTL